MSEVLLIHPGENARIFGGMPPLGLAWIASYLESHGFKVDLLDLQISDRTFEEVLQDSIPGSWHSRDIPYQI